MLSGAGGSTAVPGERHGVRPARPDRLLAGRRSAGHRRRQPDQPQAIQARRGCEGAAREHLSPLAYDYCDASRHADTINTWLRSRKWTMIDRSSESHDGIPHGAQAGAQEPVQPHRLMGDQHAPPAGADAYGSCLTRVQNIRCASAGDALLTDVFQQAAMAYPCTSTARLDPMWGSATDPVLTKCSQVPPQRQSKAAPSETENRTASAGDKYGGTH